MGAAGRLLISGELESVEAIEDPELFAAANPVKAGTVRFDPKANERQEDAIARVLLGGGNFVVVVLGGAHDLRDNLPQSCRYERFSVKSYRALGGKKIKPTK